MILPIGEEREHFGFDVINNRYIPEKEKQKAKEENHEEITPEQQKTSHINADITNRREKRAN